ncbi:hypothetical protein H6F77_17475 [Microcoleus sp. FACHB-831]|jgi:hypothetical protein|uniref:hypothetical protein n=1 Tax=Microcoleus sp. FACHB-831 TaxID=2692827 RepID=UPI001682D275|nr:hypothetical protein [Microcoleus sp. FACHB-831]MBD1922846.1 hypothetical protein [Microcoleus sp. FACHB-831]
MHKAVAKRAAKFLVPSGLTPIMAIATLASVLLFKIPQGSQAQAQTPPIFENVTIGSKFSPDPLTIRGLSGGEASAKTVAGRQETLNGPCVGFMNEKPDHTLRLTSFFNYLSIVVESPEDTTIVIKGPGGTWCNDEYQGKNPGIAGQWLAGKYQIWVGSYDQKKYHPYSIKITSAPLLNPGPFRR